MGGNGKLRRWRLHFHRPSSNNNLKPPPPPQEFVCPICNSLMSEPTVVTSGHTFDRICVQVCNRLSFTPTLPDGSSLDLSTAVPNLALKTAIHNWCESSGSDPPDPPNYSHVESIVRERMRNQHERTPRVRVSEKELLNKLSDTPPVLFSHSATELKASRDLNSSLNLYSSSSSEESVIANTSPLLPFATRPSCFSSSSSPSTSSEFYVNSEEATTNCVSVARLPTTASASASASSGGGGGGGEDDGFVERMTSLDVYEQEQAVIQLRKTTRTNEEARTALCTERLLLALKPLLCSRYAAVQTNAAAALVNLSLEKGNKVRIVRAGIVPMLIENLKNGFEESREHAAGAIFSLSLEDGNKTAIGVLGAMQPLLHELRSGTRRSRRDAALALYHLTLVRSNRMKIMRLGGAGALLGLLRDSEVAGPVVLVVCNLAACEEGRAALLDANAVECLVGLLRKGSEMSSGFDSTQENCVAALHSLSHGSIRFKGLARDSETAEVLRKVAETGSERARDKARRILEGLRGPEEAEDGDEVDWEAVMKGGVGWARHHHFRTSHGPNSTEF